MLIARKRQLTSAFLIIKNFRGFIFFYYLKHISIHLINYIKQI